MKKRLIFENIFKQKDSNKVSVIIGARQVGKTTILKSLHKKLKGLFLDLDIFSNFEKVSTYENFINTLKIAGYKEKQKNFFYVFLDEFQRYSDITRIIKNVYDHHKNIKIFATGSSSLGIKNRLQESLSGRKIITNVYPLNFEEFLIFKDQKKLLFKIKNLMTISSENYLFLIPKLDYFLNEFLIFGGYPEVVLEKDQQKKISILASIFDLYVKKDLVDYLKIEKISQAKILIEKLAINHGGITNYSELAMISNLDIKTIKNYLYILEETFLISILKPFFRNKNKEISKAPKIYFIDNGVRNYFFNNFNNLSIRNDNGVLFESFYIGEILKRGEKSNHLKYYRSKQKLEVDLILDRISEILPIELKFRKSIIKNKDINSLNKFISQYNIKKAYLVSLQKVGLKNKFINMIDCFNKYF